MYTYIHTRTHMKVMKQLLLNGGNPHAKTKKGETPLHFAAAKGDHIMVKILAALGVDLQVSVVYGNQSRRPTTRSSLLAPTSPKRWPRPSSPAAGGCTRAL